MSEPTENPSLYPVTVELPSGTYTLLDPEGEPSGPRVSLPNGGVTALNASGGIIEALSSEDQAALQAAVPTEPEPEEE